MNNWYIDRSKNFICDGLRDILSIINESELSGAEMSTKELAKKFAEHKALGNAIGNPNAAFTRFRDHGLIRMNNSIGDTAKMYLNEKFTFGELIIDLFVKRFASKDEFPSLHPVVMLCKLFSCMMNMGVDIDDVFITYFECHEYLLPINSYEDVNYELVEKIISEREYRDTDSGSVLQNRIELSDNEETNYSIWFNALKQTPLFISLEENDNRYTLRPNQKQKEFFNYLSENADEFKDGDIKNNATLYKYYCNREYGLSEIIAPVIKSDVTIEKDDVKVLFDYLFGYDQKVDFDYSTYVKHECFGTYFAFISIPDIAIAKIEEENPQIADQLYKYVRNMGTYYLDNIDIAYGNLKSGEKAVADISSRKQFRLWAEKQLKPDGEPYSSNTLDQYISALTRAFREILSLDVFEIKDKELFSNYEQSIRNDDQFEKINEKSGNGALSSSLKLYGNYLQSLDAPAAIAVIHDENVEFAWFVGAQYDGTDHTDIFVKEGIWRYGGEKIDIIDTVKAGDKIAIKAMCVQKNGLPFENCGKSISCLIIKAIGTVVENLNSENTLVVDWERLSPEKRWYVYTGKLWGTVGKISKQDGNNYKNLIEFAFEGKPQPYEDIDIQPDEETPDDGTNQTSATSGQSSATVVDEPIDFEYEEIPMEPKQIIYYGAPGTGKSFEVDKQLIEKYSNEEARDFHTARVVFHPDYTYSDFVGSIRPVKPDGKSLTYEFVAGPFSELLKKCFLHSNEEFYLVLEEINRGNAAAIFGDLFQLLDRDNKIGKSSYRINNTDIAGFLKKDKRLASLFANDKVWLPSNFNIVCTMNTADQNVFVLDSAFKRRFSEEYTEIDFSKLTKELKEATAVFNGSTDLQQLFADTNLKKFVDKLAEKGELKRDWPTFAKIVNYIIDDINEESGSEQISEDKKLGPFFVSVKDLENRKNFINKVLHYLKQDVFKYVDFYFTESYQTLHSKYIKETADIFNLLKRQGE